MLSGCDDCFVRPFFGEAFAPTRAAGFESRSFFLCDPLTAADLFVDPLVGIAARELLSQPPTDLVLRALNSGRPAGSA